MTCKPVLSGVLSLAVVSASYSVPVFVSPAFADETVRCESKDDRYRECPIGKHGYVRLSRELSYSDCTQGRSWDYDKRRIWVDDGCRAEFVVEDRDGSGSNSGAVAAVAVLGVLALAAAASSDKKDKDHKDHYDDDGYYGGGHSSYVKSWMVGSFEGYNTRYGADVELDIGQDGRAKVRSRGQTLSGYVNDDRLYVGDAQFYIERAGNGFNTRQVGHDDNVVHYERD